MARKRKKNIHPAPGKPKSAQDNPVRHEKPEPVSSSQAGRVALYITLTLFLLLGASLGWREIGSPDFGFHLSTARWIVQNHWVPSTDPLTYTIPGHAYVDLQWGFQLLLYALQKLGGAALVVTATTVLTLVFSALLLLRTRRREGLFPLSSFLLLLLFFLGNYWEPRPHLFSWLWGSLVLLVMEEYARGNKRWLPALPVLMILWVNFHSLYVLGLVIMGTYCLAELIRKKKDFNRPLLTWCTVAAAACLLNPYHLRGLLFPLVQLRDIQSGAYKSAVTGIAEFTSPFSLSGYFSEGRLVLFQPRLWWQVYTLLVLTGAGAAWRKIRLAEWILLAGFFYVFMKANKNFGYFVMVSFPIAASGLSVIGQLLWQQFSRKQEQADIPSAQRRWQLGWLAGCSLVCLLLIPLTLTGRLYDLAWSGQKPGAAYSKDLLPVEACRFLSENNIEGRLLNTWGQGGYISWATRQKVFMYSHGEVTGPKFYQEYIQGKQPGHFEQLLEKWMPTVAIVPFKVASYWLYDLDRRDNWHMVYADEHTAVFLLGSLASRVPAMPPPRPGRDYPDYDETTMRELITRAAGGTGPGFWQWLRGRAAYPMRDMALSAFYLHTSEVDACIGVSLHGIEQTPFLVPELMLNLGHALNARRRYKLADQCFNAFLRADDDPVIAAEIASVRRTRK